MLEELTEPGNVNLTILASHDLKTKIIKVQQLALLQTIIILSLLRRDALASVACVLRTFC